MAANVMDLLLDGASELIKGPILVNSVPVRYVFSESSELVFLSPRVVFVV